MNSLLLTPFILAGMAIASDFRVTLGISQITGQVGVGFDPNRIVPTAGDTITFSWQIPSYIQNPPTGSYSATQGSFDSPCKPLGGGFDSGAKTTGPESAGQAPTMTFTVKDDKPLYFFSSVGDQCKQGMVLGVNSPASGAGSVESYIIAAGGNPNANYPSDNSTSSTNISSPSTTPKNSTVSTSTNATKPVTSSSTNTTSAKPTSGAATLSLAQSSLAYFGLLAASVLL